MIKSPIFGAAAIAIIFGAADAATAQSPPPRDQPNHLVERFLTIYDTNGDGTVSQTEIAAEQKRIFAASDFDGDGKLSVAEIQAPSKRWFKRYDKNGNGIMEADEIPEGHRRGGRRGRRR